jgi:hypothetical protein
LYPAVGPKIDKYHPLPAINSKGVSFTNSIYYFNIVTAPEQITNFPKPVRYFVGINAQSHNESEFKSLFNGYQTFFRKQRTGYAQASDSNVF